MTVIRQPTTPRREGQLQIPKKEAPVWLEGGGSCLEAAFVKQPRCLYDVTNRVQEKEDKDSDQRGFSILAGA